MTRLLQAPKDKDGAYKIGSRQGPGEHRALV